MNVYFAADVHLGLPVGDAAARERRFVRWLDAVKRDATEVFLLGDIFDFWCEYRTVVPRGFVRTLGKLAELTDSGIPVHFFIGNHDLWLTDYLRQETGLIVHLTPLETELGGQRFYLAHGDYLPLAGARRSLLRALFTNRFLQRCFRAIHPRWGLAWAHRWSHRNRLSKELAKPFGGEQETTVQLLRRHVATPPVHHYIFGHRHTPVQYPLGENTLLTVLGEWIEGGEYAVFDGKTVQLRITN
ncbi:MAG: UDP-2,3-diacylglucosamine diphosphatase [Prevotellaceae bacterium]|jgi:UDP-2,3-diacylglucosamine hydrolase|nr:UDP-2,3-diacylglucosamine diphosphatase [Prevotellaceae bacterium]